MSILTKKPESQVRSIDPNTKSASSDPIADSSLTHPVELEAPDWGESEAEAPEARVQQQMEAPDAGEGRMGVLESEFTHGRSQS